MYGMAMIAAIILLVALVRSTPLPIPHWWQLGGLAALTQLPAYYNGGNDNLFRISYVLLCLVAWRNREATGGKLILAGLVLNAVPILSLGRMPISPTMLAWGQQAAHIGEALQHSKDVVIASSPLLVLGDTLPVALGSWRAAWSIGDVVLCCGALRYAFANQPSSLYISWRPSPKGYPLGG